MSELSPIPESSRKFSRKAEKGKEVIEKAFTRYVEELKGLQTNIIRGLFIVVATPETPSMIEYNTEIFHILTQDFELKHSENQDFYIAGKIATNFKREVNPYLRIYISNIEPSHIDELRQKCQEFKMEIEEIYFY